MSSATLPLPSGSRRAINPWFVGAAVVIPTLMGVVGTTIVGVARPYIAGGLSAPAADDEWVMTSYLAANAFILADHRLAVGPLRPPQLLPLVDCRLHHCLGAVRHGHQPAATDPVPGNPGTGRRRVPALEPGDPAGQPPAREAGRRPDDVRHRRPGRADRRPGAQRLARRQLQLALDLLHQRAGGARQLPGLLRPAGGPGLPEARAGGTEEAAAQLRWHRPGAARPRHRLLGSDARQGARVGLAGRPVLAGADAADRVRAGAGRPPLPGADVCQPGGQLPGAPGAQLRRVLRHHFRRLRRAVRGQRGVAADALDHVRLRRLRRRTRAVARRRFRRC